MEARHREKDPSERRYHGVRARRSSTSGPTCPGRTSGPPRASGIGRSRHPPRPNRREGTTAAGRRRAPPRRGGAIRAGRPVPSHRHRGRAADGSRGAPPRRCPRREGEEPGEPEGARVDGGTRGRSRPGSVRPQEREKVHPQDACAAAVWGRHWIRQFLRERRVH